MKILLLPFLMLFAVNAIAQTPEAKTKKDWIVKWNATAAIDGFSFPTAQFAVEKRLTDYISVQVESGVQLYNFNRMNADTTVVDNSGFRLLAETRFYLFKYFRRKEKATREDAGVFTGIQFFYRKNNYNERINYTPQGNNGMEYIDDFGIRKEVYGVNFTMGSQFYMTKRFILEPYFSIGALKRNIKNVDRSYDEDEHFEVDSDPHGDFVTANDLEERSGSGGNFAFGLRLCYVF